MQSSNWLLITAILSEKLKWVPLDDWLSGHQSKLAILGPQLIACNKGVFHLGHSCRFLWFFANLVIFKIFFGDSVNYFFIWWIFISASSIPLILVFNFLLVYINIKKKQSGILKLRFLVERSQSSYIIYI